MKLSILFFGFWLLLSTHVSGQVIVKEATFDPEGKAKITNLSEVQVDKENNEMKLFFLTKSTDKKMKAEILYFDLDFNFLRNENIEEEYEKLKVKYKLSLNYCPESKEPLLAVEPNFSGQTVFKKGYIERYFNWNTGFCDDRFKVEDKVKPKGDDGEKIKLIAYWSDNEIENYFRRVSSVNYSYWKGTTTYTSYQVNKARQVMRGDAGDVVFLGLLSEGIKDPNLGKRYAIQKFSVAKLEKVNEIPLNFDVVAVPIFKKFLSNGNVSFVFHREDNKIEYLEVNFEGQTQKRFVKDAPTEGTWIIDDIVETENGELLVTGVISTREFPKWARSYLLYPHNISTSLQTWAWKPSGFQVMKVTKDIDFIAFTSVKEFPPKLIAIDGEKKKGDPYKGGPLVVGDAFLTKSNEVVVTAQKKDNKGKMSDIYAFYFDNRGKLLAHYSTPIRDKNEYNQTNSARQALMNSPSTNDVYWTIFEVVGEKKRGETARILYSPRIARIQQGGKKVSDFLDFMNKRFYLDDKFPVNYVDGKEYIFLGSDKAGKLLMFYKVQFE